MLLGLILWPRLLDGVRGRKFVIVSSLFGSFLGLGLQSFALLRGWSLGAFLATRAFTGCFAGSSPVTKAYLADVVSRSNSSRKKSGSDSGSSGTDGEDESGNVTNRLSKYLAWRDASSTLAYIIGPTLGGVTFEACRKFGFITRGGQTINSAALAFVIGLSAWASLIASLLVKILVQDDTQWSKKTQLQNKSITSSNTPVSDEDFEIVSCPFGKRLWTGIMSICAISFFYHVADSTFFAFYPAFLKNNFGLDTRAIGLAFTLFASVSFTISASSMSTLLIKRIGVVNTCAAGLATVGTSLGLLGCLSGATAPIALGAAALYFCGVPLYGPTIPTILLQCVPPYQRGTVMGIDGTVNTIARVISPLFMGEIYRRSGASTVFGVASFAVFSGAAIALWRRFVVLRTAASSK